MTNWTPLVDILPAAKQGVAEIRHITVSREEAAFSVTRAIVTGRDSGVREGEYTQLLINGSVMMSDTPMEKRSNLGILWNAKGHVLIAGLGIGMLLPPLLQNPAVTKVTVVELHQDVIDLVEPHIRAAMGTLADKLEVVHGDIFTWTPPKGVLFETQYFDIWQDICTDNLAEMATLHRRFARRKASPEAWVHSWMKDKLKAKVAAEKRRERHYGFARYV